MLLGLKKGYTLADMISSLAIYIGNLRGYRAYLLAFAMGALGVLAFAPFHFLWTVPICLCVLVWQLDGCKTIWRTFLISWMFGVGFYAVGLHWMSYGLLVDSEAHAIYLIPLVFFWLSVWPFCFVVGCVLARRFFWADGLVRLLGFAAMLTLADWARGHLPPGGLPWNLWGNTLTASLPWTQMASLVGVYGLSLVVLTVATIPALFGDGRGNTHLASKRILLITPSVAIVFAMTSWMWGAHYIDSMPKGQGIAVRLVQPNIDQFDKIRLNNLDDMAGIMLRLSFRPEGYESLPTPEVIVWPEIALPVFLEEEKVLQKHILKHMPKGSLLVAGSLRAENKGLDVYNSLMVFNYAFELQEYYDKKRLFPFGEYSPHREFLASIGFEQELTGYGFVFGKGSRILELGNLPDAGALICYEAIFPGDIIPTGNRPDWLVNVSNDAWFGDSIGPWQHLDQVVVRAIEEGLPIARSTNTGISALIDANGRILSMLKMGERRALDIRLPPPAPETVYSRIGNVPMFAATFLLLLLSGWTMLRRRLRT